MMVRMLLGFLSIYCCLLLQRGTNSAAAPQLSNLRITEVTHTSADIAWDIGNVAADDVDHYLLAYTPTDGQGEQTILQVTDTSYELADLEPSTKYNVSVSAEYFSTPLKRSFTTLSLGATTVTLSHPTLTTLTAKWKAAGGDGLTGYEVLYQLSRNGDIGGVRPLPAPTTKRCGPEQREMVLTGLEPATLYFVRVIPLHGELVGDSGSAENKTDQLSAVIVRIANTSISTVAARWKTNFTYNVQSWIVQISSDQLPLDYRSTRTVDGDQLNTVFHQLKRRTLYSVQVVGQVEEDGRKFAIPKGEASKRTKYLKTPTVSVIDRTVSSISFNWTKLNLDALSWTVKVYPKGRNQYLKRQNILGDSIHEAVFDDLLPNTRYKIEVIGHTVQYDEEFDSLEGRNRAFTKPLTGTHVQCSNTTASSVTVEWTDVNVKVDSWTIKLFPEGMEQHTQEVTQESDKRKYVFGQLQPATYVSEVIGNYVLGNDAFYTPAMRYSCTIYPSPPRNIEVIDRGVTYLVVTFDPSRGPVDSYRGTCISVDQEDDVVKGEFATNSEMQCTGLDPATEYKIVVKSVFNGLESDPIATSNVTLSPPPSGLTLIEPTTHTMMAEWQVPGAERIDRYFVTYNSSYYDVEIRVVEGSQTTLLLTGLEPNTMYSVQVQAEINEQRSSPDSASESTLSEIINLQIDDVGFTSINVSWNPSEVPHLQSYCLEYSPALQPDFETELILPSDINQFVVTDLQTATEYKLAINARYSRSESEESERFATTLALPPIGPLTFSNITETSFVAHWLPPDGAPQPVSYTVTYYTEGMEPIIVENVESPELLIEGLESETTYNATVSAYYQDDLASHKIKGKETTLSSASNPNIIPTSCSCTTYLRTQSQMQSMLVQMMQQIDVLNQKIDALTSRNARSVREIRNHRRKRRI